VSKAGRLTGTPQFLCLDHENDLFVVAGINAPSFQTTFFKASTLVSLLRNSKNLYRKLRDHQVQMTEFDACVAFVVHFSSFRADFPQLDLWTYQSIPMVMPSLFVVTRWQSKHKMLETLLANKQIVIAMCAAADNGTDPECASLRDKGLSPEEWVIIEV